TSIALSMLAIMSTEQFLKETMRSGQAPMQMPQRRQRYGLNLGVPFSSSSSEPKGHSSLHRLQDVQRCMKKLGKDKSPARGWTACPRVASSMLWIAFITAPQASSSAVTESIGARTAPAV